MFVLYTVIYVTYILFDWLEWKKQKKVGCAHFAVCNTRQIAYLPSVCAITLGKQAHLGT
jgi:hypothetical protein